MADTWRSIPRIMVSPDMMLYAVSIFIGDNVSLDHERNIAPLYQNPFCIMNTKATSNGVNKVPILSPIPAIIDVLVWIIGIGVSTLRHFSIELNCL
jgi:hypothetical protein